MKKKHFLWISLFILLCMSFLGHYFAFGREEVIVSAIVGTQNYAPLILEVLPNSDPRILKVNKTQSYTLYFRDDEKDEVYYTITPNTWFSNPISGTISSTHYDSNSGAYINFLYLAPPNPNAWESIIVTIDDGSNLISKKLNLFIY